VFWHPKRNIILQVFALIGLEEIKISGGKWNKKMIMALFTWLARCVPNLKSFVVYGQPKETANLFIDGLSQNNAFLTVFKDKLEYLFFFECNLTEDLRSIMVDIRSLYEKLATSVYSDSQAKSEYYLRELVVEDETKEDEQGMIPYTQKDVG
jgi:hypothetical protein